jgi:hypothetical protein
MTSDINIDHADLLQSQNPFPSDFDHAEYMQWLKEQEDERACDEYWEREFMKMQLLGMKEI